MLYYDEGFKRRGWPENKFKELYSLPCFYKEEGWFYELLYFSQDPIIRSKQIEIRNELETKSYSEEFFNEIMQKLFKFIIFPYKQMVQKEKLNRIEKDF